MFKPVRLAAAALTLGSAMLAVPAASQASPTLASGPRANMIVVLRAPVVASKHAMSSALFRSYVGDIVRPAGGTVVKTLSAIHTAEVRLSASQEQALLKNPQVTAIYPNGIVNGPKVSHVNSSAAIASHAAKTRTAPMLCGTAANPQLNPEALTNINAPSAWSQGAIGAGISVGFMADGLDPTVPDFQRNAAYASAGSPAGSPVIANSQDFSGDGTAAASPGGEAFLDASSIGAQGNTTYDLSNYSSVANPMPAGCDIKVVGVAPGSNVVELKVFGSTNASTTTGFIEAINYAVAHGVKVLNESFGSNPMPDGTVDAISNADDAAVAAGVTVVVSSGDAGVNNTIGSPASDPNVISVGASTTFRNYAQTAFGGINAPGESGNYLDNNISGLSSSGMTQRGGTINLVAPGDLNWALCTTSPSFADCSGQAIQSSGGTSESAPLVSGAVADVIQAYRTSHGGAYPAPALIKTILTSTAKDIFASPVTQGAGMLDVGAAVALAKHVNHKSTTAGAVLASATGTVISGLPGTKATATVKFTNASSIPTSLALSTRSLNYAGTTGTHTVTMDPSTGTTQPKFTIWSGATEVYQKATFNVNPNTGKIEFLSNFAFTGQNSLLHVSLFDPNGDLAGYSLSQGSANYVTIDVARPLPGTWTAFFFTVWNGNSAGAAGTSGQVAWQANFYNFSHGHSASVSSVALAANGSAIVKYSFTLPNTPGDSSLSLFAANAHQVINIPVTERVSVPFVGNIGQFSGTFTGGNGRGAPALSQTYNFAVPAGEKNLEADIELTPFQGVGSYPGTQVIGALISPTGQIVAYDTNYSVSGTGNPSYTPYLSLYVAHPVAGNYQFELWVANPVVTDSLFTNFHGQLTFNAVNITSTLPNSATTKVSNASGSLASVTITNNGFTELNVSTDARSNANITLGLSDSANAGPTQAFNKYWQYFVPPQTSSITTDLSATLPASFDMGSFIGNPDISPLVASPGVSSTQGSTTAALTYAPAGGVQSGAWYVQPTPLGPFTTTAVAAGTATVSTSIVTKGFDTSISTSSGDIVTALMGVPVNQGNGVLVDPGQSVTIQVMIQPTAAVGSIVSGTLSVNSFSLGFFEPELLGTPPMVSDMATLPFKYKVGL